MPKRWIVTAPLALALTCSLGCGGNEPDGSGSGGSGSTPAGGGHAGHTGVGGGSIGTGGSDGGGTSTAGGGHEEAGGGDGTGGGASTGGDTGPSAGGSAGGGTGNGGGSGGGSAGGGTGGTGGAGETLCSLSAVKMTWTGSAKRPQLTADAAGCYTIGNYLGAAGTIGALSTDRWNPTAGLGSASSLTPTFTVAADGSGTHTSVQAAISAAMAKGGTSRLFILVKPGIYREPVCVNGSVPLTLYGADTDASKVTIAFDNYNGKAVATSNPCSPASGTFGTSNSSSFFVKSNGFQAMNLTIANDYLEPGNVTAQAVAMTTTGDKLVFQNVRFIGNQDTLQPSTPDIGVVARSYYKSCSIEGDTDFIFGKGTAVFDACKITYTGIRKTSGCHLAPSTSKSHPFGFLIINSQIIAGPSTVTGAASLGRSWSEKATSNGQTVIRNTKIDNHINATAPYRDATGSAIDPPPTFDPNKSRFFEFENTGAGAAR